MLSPARRGTNAQIIRIDLRVSVVPGIYWLAVAVVQAGGVVQCMIESPTHRSSAAAQNRAEQSRAGQGRALRPSLALAADKPRLIDARAKVALRHAYPSTPSLLSSQLQPRR